MNEYELKDFKNGDLNNISFNEERIFEYVKNKIGKYGSGINKNEFSGIIGATISYARQNGIKLEDYDTPFDYAVAVINFRIFNGSDYDENSARNRFKKMLVDEEVRLYIFNWIVNSVNS